MLFQEIRISAGIVFICFCWMLIIRINNLNIWFNFAKHQLKCLFLLSKIRCYFSISQSKSDQNKEMWHDKKCINFKWYLNRQDIKYYDLKKKKKKRCQLHWSFHVFVPLDFSQELYSLNSTCASRYIRRVVKNASCSAKAIYSETSNKGGACKDANSVIRWDHMI